MYMYEQKVFCNSSENSQASNFYFLSTVYLKAEHHCFSGFCLLDE